MTPPPTRCVAVVPSGRLGDPAFESAVDRLPAAGCPVWRVRQEDPPPAARDALLADALAAGVAEVLLLDPAVVFDPADVERLRSRGLPVVCGAYPDRGRLSCTFPPGVTNLRLGTGGGPAEVLSCGLGFALVKREVLAAVGGRVRGRPAFFSVAAGGRTAEDAAFCSRVRAAGFKLAVDTSIRVWSVGTQRLGWEDVAGPRPRSDDITLDIPPTVAAAPAEPPPPGPPVGLRPVAAPLPATFPRFRAYVVTYPAARDTLKATLASVRESDWGEEPVVIDQPADWPPGLESAAANYRRALEAAASDGCDFALVLEDDVRVCRHMRHNLTTNPLVARDGCDYLGLFMPDLIADPWERSEPDLGYRLARPRYSGAERGWARGRVWGSQAYLLSRRFVLAALEAWTRLGRGQDARVMGTASAYRVPLWYTAPCLVQHAPVRSEFGTPTAYAPDFDPDFRLEVGGEFRPPDGIPGTLTRAEGELLWRWAAGRDILEVGPGRGRGTVCLAQSARRVVAVVPGDPSEVAEWARRFGVADRVEFRREAGTGGFGMAVIDGGRDEGRLSFLLVSVSGLLAPGGLVAVKGYPDPARPHIRPAVDELLRQRGWIRVAQADFLGIFRT